MLLAERRPAPRGAHRVPPPGCGGEPQSRSVPGASAAAGRSPVSPLAQCVLLSWPDPTTLSLEELTCNLSVGFPRSISSLVEKKPLWSSVWLSVSGIIVSSPIVWN